MLCKIWATVLNQKAVVYLEKLVNNQKIGKALPQTSQSRKTLCVILTHIAAKTNLEKLAPK
jgi:hypothetical protein